MKLAIDCRMIGSGGIGSYLCGLLPTFLAEHHCLLLASSEQCASFSSHPNAEWCECTVRPFSLMELSHFPRTIAQRINGCDAYFTPYCNIPGGIRVPIFSTIHDIVFLDVHGLTSALGRFARHWFYQHAINRSRTVFTVSEFSRSRIRAKLRCNTPVVVTYNAAPAYLHEPLPVPIAKTDTILFVGNIKRHKGLDTLLAAFGRARAQGLSATLTIVGNAEHFRTGDTKTVRFLANAAERGITFTGKISDEQLKLLYAQARVLVQPSRYEGFGMPPLEAMTVGTPAIVSDIPVFREIYRNFPVTYFTADNANDLAEKLLVAFREPARHVVVPDVYSYEKSAERILRCIQDAL
ncbi:MAG: glycosyltransferase family 4 protein [Treponema sp.]|nr:glycosyltransferase family 4 protein [Treponema sp.]